MISSYVDFTTKKAKVIAAITEFEDLSNSKTNNFLKAVKWSPDGSCLLSSSEDNSLRLFHTSEKCYQLYSNTDLDENHTVESISSNLIAKEGETIYDFCWYPFMNSNDPTTCLFLSSTRDNPIHIIDAYSGKVSGSYRAFDQMDEITSAYSLSFNKTADKIYCGFNNSIRVFDTQTPGRQFDTIKIWDKKEKVGQRGIISSLDFGSLESNFFAAGSYGGTIALYSDLEQVCVLDAQKTGVTQVKFSVDGNYVFAGGRKSNDIFCWDIRTGDKIVSFQRICDTNQRMYFDLDPSGRYLYTGCQDNSIWVYDLQTFERISTLESHKDLVNGCSIHPYLPILASSSGQRKFILEDDSDDEEEAEITFDNSIILWALPNYKHNFEQNQNQNENGTVETNMEITENENPKETRVDLPNPNENSTQTVNEIEQEITDKNSIINNTEEQSETFEKKESSNSDEAEDLIQSLLGH